MSGLVIIRHLLVNLADCFPFFNVSVIYLFTCVTSSSGLISLACKLAALVLVTEICRLGEFAIKHSRNLNYNISGNNSSEKTGRMCHK